MNTKLKAYLVWKGHDITEERFYKLRIQNVIDPLYLFNWLEQPEGYDYWNKLYGDYCNVTTIKDNKLNRKLYPKAFKKSNYLFVEKK